MKKNIILTFTLVALVFASCSKQNDIKPEYKPYTVELIEGSKIVVSTTDTTFLIWMFTGVHIVPGTKLALQNISSSEATVRVNNKDWVIQSGERAGYGAR